MTDTSPSPMNEYRTAVTAIRENAKWGLKTLGAVAAALIAGLGLSSLANIHSTGYLLVALAGIAVALVGVGWLFLQTARVLAPSTVSLASILVAKNTNGKPGYLKPVLDREQAVLGDLASDFNDLQLKSQQAAGDYNKALIANYDNPTETSAKLAEAADARSTLYEQAIEGIEGEAAYREIASRVHPFRQVLAAALVAIGVGAFAVALALPTDPKPDFHGARLSGDDLTGTRLVGANFSDLTLTSVSLRDADLRRADFEGATLHGVDLLGADVKGASFEHVNWQLTICPDGADSDLSGDTCEQHLEVRAAVAAPTP